jgi:uncharacterized protein
VSDLLQGKSPIKSRHIRPGQGQAVEVKTGQLLQIQTLQGKQVADFVAFGLDDREEYLSTSVTQSTNASIVPQKGMTLFSNRRQGMFEIVEDTVGRHDMLYACCDPIRYEQLGAPGHANCREALTAALSDYGVGYDRIPTPINWFMNVAIRQRGELEIREPLAEQNDYVLLRALKDVVAAVSACPQDLTATNGFNPSDIRIRVFREGVIEIPAEPEAAEAESDAAQAGEAAPSTAEERAARRAARREERRANAAAAREAGGEIEAADAGPRGDAPVDNRIAAESPGAVEAEPTAPNGNAKPVAANARPTPPARLRDTPEATVMRVELSPNVSDA